VTATSVLFGATTVTDGSGASFLAPMDDVMSAVADKVNHAGGICGRQLKLTLANDSWQENLGEQYIQNFVEGSHVFGLAVNPDSEGLYGASRSGYLDRQQVPVVGTGGQTSQEYTDPWIWPVGTATISQMHIMVQDAYNRGARGFGIVFDAKYHFGVEGAYAYDQAVKRLTGHDVPGYSPSLNACSEQFCGIQPAQSSYTSTAQQFDTACYQSTPGHTGSCQFVAYLLEPDLALSWLSSEAGEAEYGYGAAEPMFDRQAFADQCTSPNCNGQSGFDVWTGFQPPEGSYAGQPAEVAYVNLMHTVDGSFDVDNQFAEGAYVGMNLLVTALQATGPDLTRQRLAAVLNATSYSSGLAPALTYRSGHHFANAVAMAWKLDYSSGHFTGFSAATGFEKDPWLGQDIQAPGQ
jgi:ABC-type branched-subunit amino acid transport system substrate-binding protein